MLSDAMARAAGWTETPMPTTTPKRLATITVNKYETPTASNAGCTYSVGVMNLTRAEANTISEFASRLQTDRSMNAMAQRDRDIAEGRRNPTITSADVRPLWGRANRDEAEVYGSPAWEARTRELRGQAFGALIDDAVDAGRDPPSRSDALMTAELLRSGRVTSASQLEVMLSASTSGTVSRSAVLRAIYEAEMKLDPEETKKYLEGDWLENEVVDRDDEGNWARAEIARLKKIEELKAERAMQMAKPKEPEPVRNRFSGLDLG